MKRFFLVILTTLFLTLAAAAQQESAPSSPPAASNPSTPAPAPAPAPVNNTPQQINNQAASVAEAQRIFNQRQNQLNRSMELDMLLKTAEDPFLRIRPDVDKLYRKTNKKDLNKLDFNQQDFTNFAAFLREKNTGLIKMIPDTGCDKGNRVVVATENCLKYDFPGAGSAYSFRTGDYRSYHLSDMIFTGESFESNAAWTQGIFVAVGDVPLEQLNLQTPALKYLVDFQPIAEQEKALAMQQQFMRGLKADGFDYGQAINVRENMTYALRSIAYDGRFYREIKGVVYDEFKFDKRKDVIIGFRVIRKEADGGVTILWKELSRKDAPKLIMKKVKK